MIITVELARRLLEHMRVDQHLSQEALGGMPYVVAYLSAEPESPGFDSVDIYFNDGWDIVDSVSFAQWHGHFDSSSDEEKNTLDALAMARSLVHREKCVLEEYSAEGKYLGSAVVAPGENLKTLCRDTARLRRVFFGWPPADEAIDFSQYYRGRHLWIEKSHKEESEQIWRQVGMPMPEW